MWCSPTLLDLSELIGHQIMALRMGKASALFLWVRDDLFIHEVALPPTDICVSHGVLRLPNCSPSLLSDRLCLQS